MLNNVYIKVEGVVEKTLGDELVLVPLSDNVASMNEVFTLNEVGAFIYDNCNGENNLAAIIDKVLDNFNVTFDNASDDVKAFIKIAQMKNVIKHKSII